MAFGILDDRRLEIVPGTGLLSDRRVVRGHEVTVGDAEALKHGAGKYAHIVLIPQPSDDPRDPLNWPVWKKEALFWTLIFATSLVGALSPLVSPGYILLAKQLHVSVDDVTSSFGFLLLGLGTFMLVQSACAVKYGHRIVYLVSVFVMFISCIWCALSPNLASIRASRIFQGFGMSALQGIVATTIEQIYCVHERGLRSAIWNFSLMAGITLGPFICGYVIQNLSWQFGFWFISIPLGLTLIATFFLVPETTFNRGEALRRSSKLQQSTEKGSLKKAPSEADEESVDRNSNPSLPSYLSQLKMWHGTFVEESLWKIFLRPLPFIFSPVTWFVFLAFGMQTVWLSLVPLCSSTIFTIEYGFNAAQIGLTNLGGLVGILLAMLVTGLLSDWGVVWMSKRNRGIYEPEFRLVFMLGMLFGVFGYVGWAVGNDHHMPWIGAVICIGFNNYLNHIRWSEKYEDTSSTTTSAEFGLIREKRNDDTPASGQEPRALSDDTFVGGVTKIEDHGRRSASKLEARGFYGTYEVDHDDHLEGRCNSPRPPTDYSAGVDESEEHFVQDSNAYSNGNHACIHALRGEGGPPQPATHAFKYVASTVVQPSVDPSNAQILPSSTSQGRQPRNDVYFPRSSLPGCITQSEHDLSRVRPVLDGEFERFGPSQHPAPGPEAQRRMSVASEPDLFVKVQMWMQKNDGERSADGLPDWELPVSDKDVTDADDKDHEDHEDDASAGHIEQQLQQVMQEMLRQGIQYCDQYIKPELQQYMHEVQQLKHQSQQLKHQLQQATLRIQLLEDLLFPRLLGDRRQGTLQVGSLPCPYQIEDGAALNPNVPTQSYGVQIGTGTPDLVFVGGPGPLEQLRHAGGGVPLLSYGRSGGALSYGASPSMQPYHHRVEGPSMLGPAVLGPAQPTPPTSMPNYIAGQNVPTAIWNPGPYSTHASAPTSNHLAGLSNNGSGFEAL